MKGPTAFPRAIFEKNSKTARGKSSGVTQQSNPTA
jgi:hypothetical protein